MKYSGAHHRIEVLEEITFNGKTLKAGRYLRVASGPDVLAEYGDKVRAVDWHSKQPVEIDHPDAPLEGIAALQRLTEEELNTRAEMTEDTAETDEEVIDFSDI